MSAAFLCDAVRTPIGRYGGALASVRADDLAAVPIAALLARCDIDPAAIDDVVLELLSCTDKLVVSALRGNAGAGGVMMALAADRVWIPRSVVLNPHYKSMGGLYGSEYWTYLLPRRVGESAARRITEGLAAMGADEAREDNRCNESVCHGAVVSWPYQQVKRHTELGSAREAYHPVRFRSRKN